MNVVEEMTGLKQAKLNQTYNIEVSLRNAESQIDDFTYTQTFAEVESMINELEKNHKDNKFHYLKHKYLAAHNKPLDAIDNLHKFFDLNIEHLFTGVRGEGYQSKVNHASLNLSRGNLKMGYLDEALKSIEETLRISQNNSDEESINHCLIFLYKIAGLLGNHIEEILLTEHAITHSLNLNNPLLMLYSSLAYVIYERQYDCSTKDRDLLKARSISWSDALHYSSKKIFSFYEQSCFLGTGSAVDLLLKARTLCFFVKSLSFESLQQSVLLDLYNSCLKEVYPSISASNHSIETQAEISFKNVDRDPLASLQQFEDFSGIVKAIGPSSYQAFWCLSNIKLFLNRQIKSRNLFQTSIRFQERRLQC
eukprot:TRINITY_DN3931_c0_g1_i1.p1 TRINITY_DN3931_c0_g1~~TRINITY_DN3931_c0_g1_i1.p1  ORF type:complete len:365 (+),score=29.56 TRINITY_DN3931_c0_g1_i1:179-1273(+)